MAEVDDDADDEELPAGWVGPNSGRGDIVTLQEDLAYLGADIAADGDYGPATTAAVTMFRNMHGLPAADAADPDMLVRLDRSVSRRTMLTAPDTAKEAPPAPGTAQEAPVAPVGTHGPVQRPEPIQAANEALTAPAVQGQSVGLGLVGVGVAIAVIFVWLQVTTAHQQAVTDRGFQRLRRWS